MQVQVRNLRIYLDTCCVNRLFDNQTQARVQRETQAITQILGYFMTMRWDWLSSVILEDEVNADADSERRSRVKSVMEHVHYTLAIGTTEEIRAEELENLGFKHYDALHIVCAESGGADVLLTTDDRMLRLAKRHSAQLQVRVENPYTWLQTIT
ncbi:PIN domain-containing protein [Candidatus Poribacteria bacterium]|nr:MAG: PIN domain-containing protein [Candidatus Poribacteria bacterium]